MNQIHPGGTESAQKALRSQRSAVSRKPAAERLQAGDLLVIFGDLEAWRRAGGVGRRTYTIRSLSFDEPAAWLVSLYFRGKPCASYGEDPDLRRAAAKALRAFDSAVKRSARRGKA